MSLQNRGRTPAPDHLRVHTANEPRLRQPIPALADPVENANVNLAKATVTLNRGGSGARNPILSGLGHRLQFHLGLTDAPTAVYVFQDRANLGTNLLPQLITLAPGVYGLDILHGAGTASGSPASGAKRNFVRVESAAGAFERELWVKSYDADIVTIEGQAALDQDTLDPVERVVEIVDDTRPWLEVAVDFMPSWNDEFQALHRGDNPNVEPGFLKAYGGAKFVSFFDEDPGTEGVGTEVNPLTDVEISSRRFIQVENTPGLKTIIARFRSKQASLYFVDIELRIMVVASTCPTSQPPVMEVCSDVYLKTGTLLPMNTPAVPSVPGVPTVNGAPGFPLVQDLLIISMRGQFVGGSPRIRIRRWAMVPSTTDLAGVQMQQIGSDEVYIPASGVPSLDPREGAPYTAAQIYTIALSVQEERNDGVAMIEALLQAGNDPAGFPLTAPPALTSHPMLIAGPKARDLCFFAPGEAGGGQGCCGDGASVADDGT